jgi:Fic family protein
VDRHPRIPAVPEVEEVLAELDRFRSSWQTGRPIPEERLKLLEERARVEAVAASCRLAGIRVPDLEVRALLAGEAVPVGEGREITGYAEARARPFPAEGEILTTVELRRLHAVMMGAKGPEVEPSPWRQQPLHIEAFDSEGRALGRVFQTLPPRLVPEKTEDLVTWFELELRSGQYHPLLLAGAFYLVLMAIAPFERGNGRLARVVAGHFLRRLGYSYARYGGIEREIEELRGEYYDAVDAAETRLWTEEADLRPWLSFFAGVLRRQADRVRARLALERRAVELTSLQRRILDLLRERGSVRAGEFLAEIGGNRNTLKDNLRRLVSLGFIEKSGERRGTRYRLADAEPESSPFGSRAPSEWSRPRAPDVSE